MIGGHTKELILRVGKRARSGLDARRTMALHTVVYITYILIYNTVFLQCIQCTQPTVVGDIMVMAVSCLIFFADSMSNRCVVLHRLDIELCRLLTLEAQELNEAKSMDLSLPARHLVSVRPTRDGRGGKAGELPCSTDPTLLWSLPLSRKNWGLADEYGSSLVVDLPGEKTPCCSTCCSNGLMTMSRSCVRAASRQIAAPATGRP